jgi:hypothetical protein
MTLKQRFKALAWQLKIAIMLVVLEASILGLVSLSAIPGGFITLKDAPTLFALIAIFLLATVLLFFIARQLVFKKRWARSAAFFWQLIQLSVAWNSFTGEFANVFIGGYLVVSSVATIYFLFTKRVIEETQELVDKD